MRFVFIAPRFHSNQADLVRKLQEEGHHVEFVVMAATKSEDHSRVSPRVLRATRFGEWLDRRRNPTGDPVQRVRLVVPSATELWAHLREIRPDVAVVRGFLGPYLVLALPWLVAHRCKLVLYTQGAKYRAEPSRRRLASASFVLRVLRLRWFTTVERNVLDRGPVDLHERLRFIPFFKYPVESALARAYAHPPRILAVAKYNRRKNLLALLRAFALLRPSGDLRLTIVGECTRPEHFEVLSELKREATQHAIEDRVRFLTNLTYESVQSQYLAHDVFVMPSYEEPASVAQLEAMANGLAVICNADNGTAHYVDHEATGFIVDGSAESIAAALECYLAEPSLAQRHGQAGLAKIRGAYSVDESYRRLMALLL